ncbi:DNA recombination protein RmuC [hydrothermal vent metagenome]|uniref:DNA recombination protein RmuC n=1 Tax=hydrothermal vent metagenome TaxID=652676 RepID=A0A1W1C7U8_9ZZZZ
MDELIAKIGNDSTLMFTGAISLVVLLFIVLVVVVSSMRVKTYKERFLNVQIDNQEKEKLIAELQKELQVLKIKNAQNEQELQQFAQTKEKLGLTEEALQISQKEANAFEKLQSQTKAKFEHTENMYEKLQSEHKALQERLESLNEENSKLRVNNARLLMKLETEARFASQLNHRSSDQNGKENL